MKFNSLIPKLLVSNIDKSREFDLNNLSEQLYSPLKKFIDAYLERS